MKKLLALVLVLTLVLGMGVGVLAAPSDPTLETMTEIKINKAINMGEGVVETPAISGEYILKFEDGSVSPAAGQTVPELGDVTSSGGVFTIPLSAFEDFGVYTYNFKELAGNTAGMTYDGRDLVLTVYVVLEDGEQIVYATIHNSDGEKMVKIDSIDNKFDAGKLSIKKEVTGNMGEKDRYFEVKVTLNPGDDVIRNDISISGGSHEENPDSIPAGELSATLKIKDEDTIVLANIPEGVTYTVEETHPGDGYDDPVYEWNKEMDAVKIINNRSTLINTGINLDNLPYILILVGAAVGLVAFTMKRRLSDDR